MNDNKPDYLVLPLGYGAQFSCDICWLKKEREGNNLLLTFRRNISGSDFKPTEVSDFQILMLRGVTCLSSGLKMAAPTCCLNHTCSSFVLNSTDCYKFYWRTLCKQIPWRSLSCVVSSSLNCLLWKLSFSILCSRNRSVRIQKFHP